MHYKILVKKSVLKKISRLPAHIQKKLVLLIDDLKDSGPVAHHWPNYSKLSADQYHCHLARKWVACGAWRKEP
ncbi:hypothetical protein H206_02936 [Candidatus Electrothrix aarhusensis]|uniref:Uncharacterized protein n=1 Tax=Candidatus Electrothrix aarhusensis TaxID=1859131 RepID=A0A3S3RMJ1_9BACT|nr:hypothetical protein H206_02936 [Candidatus Electrothrix aarhusensis]